jgi:DNA (cytosine-5)-methyltransferase 1
LERPGPVNGLWREADWLFCRDGFWRPVEPGTFPLVDGATARVGRLRAYGNAICLPQATAFVEAVMEVL